MKPICGTKSGASGQKRQEYTATTGALFRWEHWCLPPGQIARKVNLNAVWLMRSEFSRNMSFMAAELYQVQKKNLAWDSEC